MIPATRFPSRRKRYVGAGEAIRRQSAIDARNWRAFRQACQSFYGSTYGDRVFDLIRAGENDFPLFCERLLGVKPLPWQVDVVNSMVDHRHIPVRGMNALGKTTGYTLINAYCAFYRKHVAPSWGNKVFRIIHLAPEEGQALQSFTKMKEILEERASEQMEQEPNGSYKARPCLLTPFFEECKPDEKHMGWSVMDQSYATIEYRPSAYKAKGADGTDPSLFSYDELRHERYFEHVLNAIILPRFLRVPHGRSLYFFTPLGASADLIIAFNRGVSGLPDDVDWHSIDLDDIRTANPNVGEEEVRRAERNIAPKYRKMVLSGRTMQPEGAKFSTDSIERAMIGTTEASWLSDVLGIRERVMARCETCGKIARGEDVHHLIGDDPDDPQKKGHPMIGFVDVASSSPTADTIACTVWDCQPPTFPRRWAEAVYIADLPTGTKIQRVALHVALMSMVIHGPVGFDSTTALGNAMRDEVAQFPNVAELFDSKFLSDAHGIAGDDALKERLRAADLMAEPVIVPHEWQRKEKDIDLDYLAGLLDLEALGYNFHLLTKIQHVNYVRKDKKIDQDWVMAQAGAGWLAKGILPDLYAEKSKRARGGVKGKPGGADDLFLGLGGAADTYFDLPSEVGDALGAMAGLGGLESG